MIEQLIRNILRFLRDIVLEPDIKKVDRREQYNFSIKAGEELSITEWTMLS